MPVKRIVANIAASNLPEAKRFYQDILGLDELMNLGWIITYGTHAQANVQISFATQGGSGTPVPDLSIEVDNIDEVYHEMRIAGFQIEYELTDEPWGVKRFFVRDPFGKLVNVLSH